MFGVVTAKESGICSRRLRKEYDEIMDNPLPNVKVGLSAKDYLNWYCLIDGLEDPRYAGGEYIFRIEVSPRYPFEPPNFYMLTPSGRFQVNKKLCFSNSSYHPESWSPIWTLKTIIMGFLSFFLEEASTGIGHLDTTVEVKQQFARDSIQHNQHHHDDILRLIKK
jgi:ubiquitin-conjugating enzyme E2 J2